VYLQSISAFNPGKIANYQSTVTSHQSTVSSQQSPVNNQHASNSVPTTQLILDVVFEFASVCCVKVAL
jgi:cytoskeletal protein RodZ